MASPLQGHVRSSSYTIEEDQLLCRIYLDISQDPITGKNQSTDSFWSRIATEYHKALPSHITNVRPKRSLHSRWLLINASISKLRGCVRQVENLRPSGASEQDILNQAKKLFIEDPKYKKGFKFDHVWSMLRDMEKYSNVGSGQSPSCRKRSAYDESQHSSSTIPNYEGMSSFSIDLNEEFENEEHMHSNSKHAERPTGRNKEKMKKKQNDEMIEHFNYLKEENRKIVEMFKASQTDMQQGHLQAQQNYELQLLRAKNEARKIDVKQQHEWNQMRREENKVLSMDIDSITDPTSRELMRRERMRICEKRAQEQQFQGGSGSSNFFESPFSGFGNNGNDFSGF